MANLGDRESTSMMMSTSIGATENTPTVNTDIGVTEKSSTMDTSEDDPYEVLETALCAALNDFLPKIGNNSELKKTAADLFTEGAGVVAGNKIPKGTKLTGLRPMTSIGGKAPNTHLNVPNVSEAEENEATREYEDQDVVMEEGDGNDARAPENPADDQAEATETAIDDVDRDQPGPAVRQTVPRTLEVDERTVDFDFSKVLPKYVLLRYYNQPYDALWFKIWAIDLAILKEWNKNVSRWKVNDLKRVGALKAGDEFVIPVVASNGENENFHVTIVGFGSGENAHIPKIRLPGAGAGSASKEVLVKGPVDITFKTIKYSDATKAQFNPAKEGWRMISVWRDSEKIDSLFDMRQKYALWDEMVRWFCKVNQLEEPRKRPINHKTGKPFNLPALTLEKR